MILSETTKLYPGSTEAKEHGCTCQIDEDNSDTFLIAPDCPIHWHLNLVCKIDHMIQYTKNKDKFHDKLFYGLIAISGCAGLVMLIKNLQ